MSKWRSRKLLVALAGVATIVLTNLGLPEETAVRITDAVVWLAGTYLGAQGVVDVMGARNRDD